MEDNTHAAPQGAATLPTEAQVLEALKVVKDPEILTRISQYEMAFRMQMSVPEVMDVSKEPQYILDMYGVQPGEGSFAMNCLLARKLVENGVRFVQLIDWGWDTHGTSEDGSVEIGLHKKHNKISVLQVRRWNEILEKAKMMGRERGLSEGFISNYLSSK